MTRQGHPRTSVYIVEDSPAVGERLSLLLTELHNVDVVGREGRAREAIDAIRATQPDVVTLDLRLAEGTGVEVLRAVKGVSRPPLVVVLTNFADQPYRTYCRNLGADYFFDKSIDLPQVLELLGHWTPGSPTRPSTRDLPIPD